MLPAKIMETQLRLTQRLTSGLTHICFKEKRQNTGIMPILKH